MAIKFFCDRCDKEIWQGIDRDSIEVLAEAIMPDWMPTDDQIFAIFDGRMILGVLFTVSTMILLACIAAFLIEFLPGWCRDWWERRKQADGGTP